MKEAYQEYKQDFVIDILIIGAGITGSFMASVLQKLGYQTAIVEKTDLNKFKQGESLSPLCKSHFSLINFRFESSYSMEFYGIKSSWGDVEPLINDFICNPYGNGVVINRNELEKDLIGKAKTEGSAIFLETQIKIISKKNNFWELRIEDANHFQTLKAKFIVIATGRNKFPQINLCRTKYFDSLIATSIISKKSLVEAQEKYLYIQSQENGWMYSNSIPFNRTIISYFTDSDLLPKPSEGIPFLKQRILDSSFFSIDQSLVDEYNQIIFSDARTAWTETHSSKGWLRVGDSAYSIDPLSGQGIAKNLFMIYYCCNEIEKFLNNAGNVHNDYLSFNKKNFQMYLLQGKKIFSSEKRWKENIFWKRRLEDNLNENNIY